VPFGPRLQPDEHPPRHEKRRGLEPAAFLMTRRMLIGLKARAELHVTLMRSAA